MEQDTIIDNGAMGLRVTRPEHLFRHNTAVLHLDINTQLLSRNEILWVKKKFQKKFYYIKYMKSYLPISLNKVHSNLEAKQFLHNII